MGSDDLGTVCKYIFAGRGDRTFHWMACMGQEVTAADDAEGGTMTEFHWRALCQLIWHLGAVLMSNQPAEVMLKWTQATDAAKNIPWRKDA